MKITIAIDSFKGSMTSLQAGKAAKEGILRVYPDAEIYVRPLADGGEGTTDALIEGMGGIRRSITVTGPLGTPVKASYGILSDQKTAVMEISSAAGITLVPPERRNPMHTTTRGVGEMIKDAIFNGCRTFIVGIGGSATNDGGVGMLQELGYTIADKNGNQVADGAEGLSAISSISADHILPELSSCTFRIACDVANPLCGPQGCSAVYGPQKGADPQMIRTMDQQLARFASMAKILNPEADPDLPGAGAAGGLGFAFHAFLHGILEPGVKIVLEETNLESYIKDSDYLITGEGKLDSQTAMGKAPAGAAAIAKKYDIPVIAFSGCTSSDAHICSEKGIDAYFSIVNHPMTLAEAMNTKTAEKNLADTAEQVFRLLKASKTRR